MADILYVPDVLDVLDVPDILYVPDISDTADALGLQNITNNDSHIVIIDVAVDDNEIFTFLHP